MTIMKLLFSLGVLFCIALSAQAKNMIAAGARNVKDYGAKGDGVSDDTQAFLDALNQGRDSHPPFFSAAAVYVPPGTYVIKKTLVLWRQTLLFGEWSNPPTLVLAPNSPDFQDPRNPKPFLVTAGGYNVRAYSTDWKTRTDQYNGSTNNTFYFLEDLKVKVGRGPLVVRGQQKLFGQSAGTIIALAAGSPSFGYGSGAPFVSVTGRGTMGQAIVGIWFWNWADGGQGGLFNADSSSVVMDRQWINKNPNNSQPALNFQSGSCSVENAWNPADGGGASQVGVLVTTDSPLELFGVQAEHFRGSAMRVQGASNVFSLNLQFELSPSYLSIMNSSNIYMSGILAGNWNFNANELVNVRNSKVSLFALNVNRDRGGVVDDTTNGNAYYGPVDTTGRIVGLSGFLK
jgi:hypothetical protein